MTRHQTLSIIIIIGLIASTIFYIGQVATAPAPCDDVQMRHLFLSHANGLNLYDACEARTEGLNTNEERTQYDRQRSTTDIEQTHVGRTLDGGSRHSTG
jgi:hypothetical protein